MDFKHHNEFAPFLREDKGFQEKVVPWMVRWVRGFFSGLDSTGHWVQRRREYYGDLRAIPRSRPSQRIPVVLSVDQISAIVERIKSPYKLMAASRSTRRFVTEGT